MERPVRSEILPYGRQWLDEEDIQAVVDVLRSDWLTTGPKVREFEEAVAEFSGTAHAVAVSSGTAALHAAAFALGIGPGDEVIVPPMTFAASSNCILYLGGKPVFVDVEPDTLNIDPQKIEAAITDKTKAIVAVDFAGQPCDHDAIRTIAERHGISVIQDASHSLGAAYKGRPVGSQNELTTFSFHPVKPITTGEGGMIVTDNEDYAEAMRRFRNHGISADYRQRAEKGTWHYEMTDLGYNYRISDIQCALGLSQLRKLPVWIQRRQEIAYRYDEAFGELPIEPLATRPENSHAYHIYVVRFQERARVFTALRDEGIGVNVHYIPVHLHPYYQQHLGTGPGLCPVAEAAYEQIISLPVFPRMTDADIEDVITAVRKVI
jgi:perosamine synthetase